MDATDLLSKLWLATWTSSAAMLAVCLLRAPVRRHFGAGAAYGLWWLVPAALLANLLPGRTRVIDLPTVLQAPSRIEAAPFAAVDLPTGWDVEPWLLAAWALGACALAAWFHWQQTRFERGLGRLECVDADARLWRAEHAAGLPALVGLWRPVIVLPADIGERFDARQRELMVLHERIHLRRGDAWINAFAALLRALFWFNPLAHLCASRLRHDQELACDARILAAQPGSARPYAEAMLKAQAIAHPLPLGCHWGATHPLKERIMQMTQKMPARGWQRAGVALVVAGIAATGFAAWSAQPERFVMAPAKQSQAQPPAVAVMPRTRSVQVSQSSDRPADIELAIQLQVDGGKPSELVIATAANQSFTATTGSASGQLTLQGRVEPVTHQGQPAYRTSLQLFRNGTAQPLANPVLIVSPGKEARVQVGEEVRGGGFKGIDLHLRVGPLSAETRGVIDEAEKAAAEAGRAADEAARDAEAAARDAAAAAEEASRHAELAAGQAERDARHAADEAMSDAEQAAREAEAQAREAERAARDAARRAQAGTSLHFNVVPAPPVPPSPPAVPRMPAPVPAVAPPASPSPPRVPTMARMPAPPALPAPPAPPHAAASVDSYPSAIKAGGRAASSAEISRYKLANGYRWVRVDGIARPGLHIESTVFVMPDGHAKGPMFAGFDR
ncbi:hypothetical protein DCD74_00295 [Lysobacter oculi]|uniref:Peptidase M56 domain-containing protein n=1 Tax=Solilutibacter oculi TaxID=2698682 RepID=A0A344J2S7_9GAMM|nr:M56 family metallopeptidase [Lysobacter oculi]AXA83337.1 hypothetical protein DCD74_00295 [Lysobacter oculi]